MIKTADLHTVHLKLSTDELEEIDGWREQHRIRTRSEAIRQMMHRVIVEDRDRATMGLADTKAPGFIAPSRVTPATVSSDSIRQIVQEEIKKALKDMSAVG